MKKGNNPRNTRPNKSRSAISMFLRNARMGKGETQKVVNERFGKINYASKIEVGIISVAHYNMDEVVRGYNLTETQINELKVLVLAREEQKKSIGSKHGDEEMEIFLRFIRLPKEVRDRIVKAALAYDSLGGGRVISHAVGKTNGFFIIAKCYTAECKALQITVLIFLLLTSPFEEK